MAKIEFEPDKFREAAKEFRGTIVNTDYAMQPFGFEGAPGIERKAKALGVQIDTPDYDKPQYEWLTPTNVRKTNPACKLPEEYPIIWDTPASDLISPDRLALSECGQAGLFNLTCMGAPSRRQMGVLH